MRPFMQASIGLTDKELNNLGNHVSVAENLAQCSGKPQYVCQPIAGGSNFITENHPSNFDDMVLICEIRR